MKRLLSCVLSAVLAIGVMPALAFAEPGASRAAAQGAPSQDSLAGATLSASASDAPAIPEAHPEAITGATAPQDEANRERIYVEDYRDRVPAGYYGPDGESAHTDDAAVIELAMAAAEGKTLVFEAGKTYKFGTYVHLNGWGSQWRIQGIHLTTSDVVIEGNGATIEWDDPQVFVGNDGLVLEGTKENPIRNIVIRNLNFKAVNNSRDWDDPVSKNTFKNHNLVQLKGMYCENVLVDHCTFTAEPNPDEGLHARSDAEGRGISNIWFYGGSKDITVQNCTMIDVTRGSQESGSNLLFSGDCDWHRDQDAETMSRYNSMSPEERYRFLCDGHLQLRELLHHAGENP